MRATPDRKAEMLLRCRNTSRFWSQYGWTKDSECAWPFNDPSVAMRVCLARGLTHVDLVLREQVTQQALFATRVR